MSRLARRARTAGHHLTARLKDYRWFFAQALSPGSGAVGEVVHAVRPGDDKTPAANPARPASELTDAADPHPVALREVTALIIPGVYESARIFRYMRATLAAGGLETRVVPGLGIMRKSVPELAQTVVRELENIDGPIVLLAHSKGGLVGARAISLALGTSPSSSGQVRDRLLGMVGIAVPWYGSALALTMPGTAVWAMRPGGRAVRAAVIRSRQRQVAQRIVCLQPAWDPHIPGAHPPPGTHRIDLPSAGHFAPLGQASTAKAVLEAVQILARAASGK